MEGSNLTTCSYSSWVSPAKEMLILSPVPLKNATELALDLNETFIKSPASKNIINFACSWYPRVCAFVDGRTGVGGRRPVSD
jgi:hypothetical protein